MRELRARFGGCEERGDGRGDAAASAEFFTQAKTVSVPTARLGLPRLGFGS